MIPPTNNIIGAKIIPETKLDIAMTINIAARYTKEYILTFSPNSKSKSIIRIPSPTRPAKINDMETKNLVNLVTRNRITNERKAIAKYIINV